MRTDLSRRTALSRFLLLSAVAAGALAMAPRAAHAQSAPTTKHAQARFREGMRLFERGEVASACRAFEESYDEAPAPGTLYNLGACHEKQGQLAKAYRELDELASRAQEANLADKATLVRARADALVPRLAQVTLVHRADARADVTTVSLDGDPLLAAVWHKPFYVDPGPHGFVFVHADGAAVTRTTPSLRAGDKQTVEMDDPPPAASSAVSPPAAASAPAARGATTSTPPASDAIPSSSDGNGGKRVASYVVGGTGVALVAAGAVLGLRAIGKRNDASNLCPGGACTLPATPADALALRHDAKVAGTFATVGFAAGGAALATAVFLFVTSGHRSERAAPATSLLPSAGPGGASVTLVTSF